MPHPHAGARHGRWAPRGRAWWIGVLFAVGSLCFLVAPFPGFLQAVGSTVDATVFFVGSLFFTSAATLQLVDSIEEGSSRLDLWSSRTQLVGTLLFNVNTFRALNAQIGNTSYDRLVWRPDAVTRVLIETTDGRSSWVTVGVGHNVIEASWGALVDAVTYGLRRNGEVPA